MPRKTVCLYSVELTSKDPVHNLNKRLIAINLYFKTINLNTYRGTSPVIIPIPIDFLPIIFIF